MYLDGYLSLVIDFTNYNMTEQRNCTKLQNTNLNERKLQTNDLFENVGNSVRKEKIREFMVTKLMQFKVRLFTIKQRNKINFEFS